MFSNAIETADLLSAYLSGDVAPEERTAVEQLLSDDIMARELLDELRELCVFLSNGDILATPETLSALREIIHRKIEEKRIKTLVGVSVTGDLTACEHQEVQAYINSHPAAVAAQRQAAAMSKLLNAGQCSADDTLADALRVRLKNALPAGAGFVKHVPEMRPDRAVVAAARPSLRIFVRTESPWKKRVMAIGGMAALVALSLGARLFWNRGGATAHNPTELVVIPRLDALPDKSPHNVIGSANDNGAVKMSPDQDNAVPREVPLTNPKTDATAQQDNPLAPQKPPLEQPRNQDLAPLVNNTEPKANVATDAPRVAAPNPIVQNNSAPKTPNAPAQNDVALPKIADSNPKPAVAQDSPKTNPAPAPASNTGTGTGTLPSTGTVTGTVATAPNVATTAPFPATNPALNTNPIRGSSVGNTIPAQQGAGVVGVLKGAGIAKITDAAGTVTTLTATGDTMPSGATLETGDVRVSFVLPGNGRLYVDRLTNLTVTFALNNTTVLIRTGEVYYIAPPGGSLTVSADKATASKIQEADVNATPSKLTVLNFSDTTLDLTAKKQPLLRVPSSVQGSVATDGETPAKRDPAVTLTGIWHADVLINGDGVKALGKSKSARAR